MYSQQIQYNLIKKEKKKYCQKPRVQGFSLYSTGNIFLISILRSYLKAQALMHLQLPKFCDGHSKWQNIKFSICFLLKTTLMIF